MPDMVSALFDIAPLIEPIQNQALLLTPNRRLAAHMKTAYAEACSKLGLNTWETPSILPLDDWIQQRWQQLINDNSPRSHRKICLKPMQETLLWESIIRDDQQSVLLKPFATAKQAQSAWRTLQLWQCELDQEFHYHPDCKRFAYWAKQFQQHCQTRELITTADLTLILADAFEEEELEPLQRILLVGFQHLPPLQRTLLNRATLNLSFYRHPEQTAQCQKIPCKHPQEELQYAAQGAKQRLEEQPDQRLAIIVPDLAQQRELVEATLAATFEPQYLLPDTPRYQLPFNISAGTPLSQAPLMIAGLSVLELLRPEVDYQTLYALLNSPFIDLQNTTDFDSAVELEVFLREGGWPTLSLAQLVTLLTSNSRLSSQYGLFIEALKNTQALQQQTPKTANLANWAHLFNRILRLFNWPGTTRRLDSIEYQHYSAWQRCLSEFANMALGREANSAQNEWTLSEALSLLRRLLTASDFQAQTPQTPIQVLGILEGGGLNFDAVWLLGVNDHQWPATASPSPFIPIKLQRDHNMPHASPERELAFSRELMTAYQQSSPLLIASYALTQDDEPLRPSALIQDFHPVETDDLGLSETHLPHPYYGILKDVPLCHLTDEQGPQLHSDTERVAGGSSLLKDQAACPFRAFASHRLSAKPLASPDFHLNAAQRGNILHSALEKLWSSLGDQSSLLTTDHSVLELRIAEAVQSALQPLIEQRQDLFGRVYTETETQRLERLLERWLDIEKRRPDFEVIATEKALVVNMGELPLRVRIDRIDRLADGSLLLIDYKTGLCSTSKWQGERLEEPQLPLYCVTIAGVEENQNTPIQSLAFARINVEQSGFVGISAHESVAQGIDSLENSRGWDASLSWSDLTRQWQQALESLANEFKLGHAPVDPVKNDTCQFCDLQPFCRIEEIKEQAAKGAESQP